MTSNRRRHLITLIVLIQLTACGGGGGSNRNPNPGPPPPQNAAPSFGALNFTGTEDTDIAARVAATDPEGAALAFSSTSAPAHGTLISLSATTGDFVYRPTANYFGADSFSVRVADAAGNATNGTVNIAITGVNDAPQAGNLNVSTDEDTSVAGQIAVSDVDDQALTYSTVTVPANGALQSLNATGGFVYQPNPGFAGSDSFQVRVTDGAGATASLTVNVTVARTSAVYSGATNAIAITEPTAARSARPAWLALKLVAFVTEEALDEAFPGGMVDTTIAGDVSGTLHLTGLLAANGTGTLTANYAQFVQGGVTLNGVARYDILEPRTASSGRVRVQPRGLNYRDSGFEAELSGNLLRVDSQVGGIDQTGVTGSLLAVQPSGVQHWFSNVALSSQRLFVEYREPGTGFFSINRWSGSARAHDSRYGYVDLSFAPAFDFLRQGGHRSNLTLAYGHGGLVATGSTALKVWLTPLSPEMFALEINRGGSTTPTCSLAFRWEDDFATPAGADLGRRAYAAAARPMEYFHARNGEAYLPEGRFSEQGQGLFLDHRWTVSVAPAGSAAQLVNPNSPRPSLTPDVSGDYLLRLVVSDGTRSSTDYINFTSVGLNEQFVDHRPMVPGSRGIAGAPAFLQPNEEVVLDGRRLYFHYDHPLDDTNVPLGWVIHRGGDDPFSPLVVNAPGKLLRFTPTIRGDYAAYLHRSTSPVVSNPVLILQFAVGSQPQFAPQLFAYFGHVALDYDADGDVDVLGSARQQGGEYLSVFRRNAAGRFDAGQVLDTVNYDPFQNPGGNWTNYFEDVSGDGRPDLIRKTVEGSTMQVAIQQPNGALGVPQTLGSAASGCQLNSGGNLFLGAVDMNRDGRNDIVRTLLCGNIGELLVYNLSNANGTFGDALSIATSSAAQIMVTATSADLDGDGDRELIGAPRSAGSPTSVQVLTLNGSGTFDSSSIAVSQDYDAFENSFRVVDINGDGRRDIIAGRRNVYVLTQNANGSFTERARLDSLAYEYSLINFPTGDVDGDGRLDLYIAGVLHRQLADGSFETLDYSLLPSSTLFDVDLDGRADILYPSGGAGFLGSIFITRPRE
jgi:VCBS repeat-containing protein